MIKIDARGDACPLPMVKAKKAIAELRGPGEVEVLVDNEIAVQNLTKMAQQKGYLSSSEKLAEQEYRVRFTIKDTPAAETAVPGEEKQQAEAETCIPDARIDAAENRQRFFHLTRNALPFLFMGQATKHEIRWMAETVRKLH